LASIAALIVFANTASATPPITATLDDNTSTRKNRGDTITNTVVISNTSTTEGATNVALTVTTPGNTTDSGTAHASPIAFDDFYTAIGNTKLYVGVSVPGGEPAKFQSTPLLLANDTIATDTISLTGFTGGTAQGGSVTVNSDGSFVYTPPVGFTGNDTFTYAPKNSTDATLVGSGTVTITVSSKVWYVNSAYAGGSNDGSSTKPFTTLTGAQTASGTNEFIYLFTGSGNYTAGITLKNTQTLIGQGVALVVNSTTLIGSGSRPTIATSGSTALGLADGNTISGLNLSPSSGRAISGSSVGALTISSMTVNVTGERALSITNGTVNITLDSVTTSGGDIGINLNGINGTVTINGGTLQNGTAADVTINGGTANVTYTGNITDTVGRCIDIQSKTGGMVAFSGTITNNASGISLTGNGGATINFTGQVGLNTGSAAAFTATGGGTISLSGSANNTLTTTTGTALNVANTTIGGSGLTFKSISAGTAASGPAKGIILNNTGAGGLTVTGSGTTDGSGGTIQDSASGSSMQRGIELTTAQNISLSNMTLNNACRVNGAVSDGTFGGNENTDENGSIYLQNVKNVTLNNVDINGSVQHGVNGNSVTNLDISNSTIQNAGNVVWESGIYIFNLKGTSAAGSDSVFNNIIIQHTGPFNLFVQNNTATSTPGGVTTYSGVNRTTMDQLTLSNSQFLDSGVNLFGDNVTAIANNGGNMRIVVSGNTFTGTVGGSFGTSDNIQVDSSGTGRMDSDISTSTFSGGGQTAINVSAAGTAFYTFNVHNNSSVSVRAGVGINVAGNGDADIRGFIQDNPNIFTTVGNNPASGIQAFSELTGTTVVSINNNVITRQSGTPANGFQIGVRLYARMTGELDATWSNNTITVANSASNGFEGFTVDAGNSTAGEAAIVKLNLVSNSIDGVNSLDYFFTQYANTTFQIQGLTGSGTSASNVNAYVATKDTDPSPTDPTVDVQGGLVVNYTAGNPATP
jgi:hypothetical protein